MTEQDSIYTRASLSENRERIDRGNVSGENEQVDEQEEWKGEYRKEWVHLQRTLCVTLR